MLSEDNNLLMGAETARERQRRTELEAAEITGSRFSYTTRLIGAFAATGAVVTLVLLSVLMFVWDAQFKSYTSDNIQELASVAAQRIGEAYEEAGSFTKEVVGQAADTNSAYPTVGVQLTDAAGEVLYDDAVIHPVSPDGMYATAREASDAEIAVSDIVVGSRRVGTIRAWVYGSSELLTPRDISFREQVSQSMLLAAIVAIFVATIFGMIASRWLFSPIKRITETAERIKDGDLNARTGMVGHDEISQLAMTFDDMTESIQKDYELERRLTADVAHELRTPLMGIQATVEAIIDGVFPADAERLAAINAETIRLKRLVEALLNLSRYETGSMPFHEQAVDLTELTHGLFMSHEALLDEAGFAHSFVADDGPVVVDGDTDMLHQAAANLLSNAVRYNSDKGSIEVRVFKRDGMGAVSISDSGIGISEADREKIFSRFWRAEAGRAHAHGGLGIGLSVVKEIVDYHRGSIEVDSEVGKGTTFTLLIPLHKAEEEPKKGIIASMVRANAERDAKNRQAKAERERAKREKAERARAEKEEKAARKARRDGAGGSQSEGGKPQGRLKSHRRNRTHNRSYYLVTYDEREPATQQDANNAPASDDELIG